MKFKFTLILLLTITYGFAQKGKTENLVMISLDGYRWQELFKGADSILIFNKKFRNQDSSAIFKKYWGVNEKARREKLMPFFWNTIFKNGQLYGNRSLGSKVNVRNSYWFSYPGRSETLCGYFDPKINSNEYPNNPNENVLEFINKQKVYNGKVVTFASWDAVSRIVNRDRNGMLVNIPSEEVKGDKLSESQILANNIQHYLPEYFGKSIRFDVHTYALTKSYIQQNHPKVVYIDFGDTDELAHAGQYDSYLDAGHYLDAMIGNLWNSMQQDPFYKDKTTFVIYPDHGRGLGDQWTGHGESALYSDQTWLVVMGPDTPALGEMKRAEQIYQDQFAQSFAHFLGMEFKANHPVGKRIPTLQK